MVAAVVVHTIFLEEPVACPLRSFGLVFFGVLGDVRSVTSIFLEFWPHGFSGGILLLSMPR